MLWSECSSIKLVVCLSNVALKKIDYESRLKFLRLDRLDIRRVKLDLLTAYKMYHQQTLDCDVLQLSQSTIQTRNECLILKDVNVCLARANYFGNRVANSWNDLPSNVKKGSESCFKKYIGL